MEMNDKQEQILIDSLNKVETFDGEISDAEFKRIINKLKMKFHPDTAGSGDDDLIKILNDAACVKKLRMRLSMFKLANDNKKVCGLKKSFFGEILHIPNGTEIIMDGAFWNKRNEVYVYTIWSTKVIIPRSVKVIGENAFRLCQNLKEVVFEHTVSDKIEILAGAFSGCYELSKINLPENCVLHRNSKYPVFDGCPLEEVKISNNLVLKGVSLIRDFMPKVKSIIIDMKDFSRILTIGSYSENYTLESVSFISSDGVVLPKEFFKNCIKLKRVSNINKITSIGASCFEGCTSLDELSFDKVKTIESKAFYKCDSLTRIQLPNTLIKVEKEAFGYCTNLSVCIIDKELENLFDDEVFNGCKKEKKAILSFKSDKIATCKSDKIATCKTGVTKVDIPIEIPRSSCIISIIVACPSEKVLASLLSYSNDKISVLCLNTEEQESEINIEVQISYIKA